MAASNHHHQQPQLQQQQQQPQQQQSLSSSHPAEPPLLPETIGKRVDPQYSQVLHARVKDILRIQHDSFPGSQPVSFETKHLTELEQEDYFVCEKSDGVRYLLFFLHSSKGPASFLFDRNRVWYYVPNLLFPMRNRDKEYLKDTLMDGELVVDSEPNDKKVWRFLIFDLMALNGVPVTRRSFNTRLGMLQQEVIAPFRNSVRHITDPSKLPPFSIELKKMERSYGLHLVLDQMSKLKHSSDGVIWTPVKYPYVPGTCDKLLKWKPPEQNTVDFRISAKWSKEHKPIYSLEVLSHGVTYKFFDHYQPEPELAANWKSHLPDGRIAEFKFDPEWEVTIVEQGYAPTTRKGGWRFVRFRTDKDTANDANVAQKILNSIRDGVTKEKLLEHMDKVRSAWKAREKGLPIPSKTPENLTLSTNARPSSSAVMTPTSATPAILPSPSVTNNPSGYFSSKDYDYVVKSRNNSIDLGRRRSEADVRKKREPATQLYQLDEEEKDDDESEEAAAELMERKRFKSWTGEERRSSTEETRRRKASTSSSSEEAQRAPQQDKNGYEHKPTSAPPALMRKSNSSNIHSLLNNTEPPQKQHNRAYDFATILHEDTATKPSSPPPPPPPPSQQQQQQQQPVHFINYHADGSLIRLAPTEGREWQQQPPPQPQQYIPSTSSSEQPVGRQLHVWKASDPAPKISSPRDRYPSSYGPPPPQYQQQQQQQHQMYPPGYTMQPKSAPPSYPPEKQWLRRQSGASSESHDDPRQQQQKKSSKAMLDFILN